MKGTPTAFGMKRSPAPMLLVIALLSGSSAYGQLQPLQEYQPADKSYQLTRIGTLPGAVAELGGFTAMEAQFGVAFCSAPITEAVFGIAPSGRANPHAGTVSFFSSADISRGKGTLVAAKKINLAKQGEAMGGAASDGKSVWQVLYDTKTLAQIDPAGSRVMSAIRLPRADLIGGLAYHQGSLWLHVVTERVIVQLEPSKGEIIHKIPSNPNINGLAWLNNRFFVTIDGQGVQPAVPGDPAVAELDPKTGKVLKTWPLPKNHLPHALSSDGKSLFIMMQIGKDVWRNFELYRFKFN